MRKKEVLAMTTEQKLKDFILMRFESVREFTQYIEMPYSTFATILSRGVDSASIGNVLKICQGLGISADRLAEGEIVPVSKMAHGDGTDLLVEFEAFSARLRATKGLAVKGRPLDQRQIDEVLDVLEIGLEIGVRRTEKR
jgi:hypothetical protein